MKTETKICPVCGAESFIKRDNGEYCAFCGEKIDAKKLDLTELVCPFCGSRDFKGEGGLLICGFCEQSFYESELKALSAKNKTNIHDKAQKGANSAVDRTKDKNNVDAKKNTPSEPDFLDKFAEMLIAQTKSANAEKKGEAEISLEFLNVVSLMNKKAYELVNGNVNAWASVALGKGIITYVDREAIRRIVAMRNGIAHGSGGEIKVAESDVSSAKKYYNIMCR